MVVAIDFKMILVAYKCKVSSKCHNEVLDVMNDFLFYNFFINVSKVTFSDFLDINEVKKVFIFEHHNGFTGSSWVRDCVYKVVRKASIVMEGILFN